MSYRDQVFPGIHSLAMQDYIPNIYLIQLKKLGQNLMIYQSLLYSTNA